MSRFANKYNRGHYAGREGWEKLSYDLKAAFVNQGLQGAILGYKITKEDIDVHSNSGADEAYESALKAKKAMDALT